MRRVLAVVLATMLAGAPDLMAQTLDVVPATGPTGQATWVLRLGARLDFRDPGDHADAGLTWYLEAGYTWWVGHLAADNHTFSLAPVFVYEFAGDGVRPFVEAGVGLGAMVHARIERRDLGSPVLFEDRVGTGLRFGGQMIGLRATHYSNAGLAPPNDGAEAYTLYYSVAI